MQKKNDIFKSPLNAKSMHISFKYTIFSILRGPERFEKTEIYLLLLILL